jgi:hypothetical protein
MALTSHHYSLTDFISCQSGSGQVYNNLFKLNKTIIQNYVFSVSITFLEATARLSPDVSYTKETKLIKRVKNILIQDKPSLQEAPVEVRI